VRSNLSIFCPKGFFTQFRERREGGNGEKKGYSGLAATLPEFGSEGLDS